MTKLLRRRRDEKGAVAILVAVLTICLFMLAALAVDISKQVTYKHELQNQLDSAAVAAGYYMETKATGCDPARPGMTCLAVAVENAQSYYQRNYDRELDTRNIDFWCVVARRQTTTSPIQPTTPGQAALFQIPTSSTGAGVCNPDAVPADSSCAPGQNCFKTTAYQNRRRNYDSTLFDMTCSDDICAIPCGLQASPGNGWTGGRSSLNNQHVTCNTIRVSSERGVPFSFAPAGGIAQGSTGQQISVACKGSCGAVAVNPMDVVVVADRTPSMSTGDRQDMVNGIRSMLTKMTPEQQFVSIGTISRSSTTSRSTSSCPSSYNSYSSGRISGISGSGGLTFPTTDALNGQWVPLKFYKDYLNSSGAVDNNSNIGKALTCIYNGGSYHGGTTLAAPLKAAARYVLGIESNNVNGELSGGSRVGQVRKVVIFETDGQPQEWTSQPGGSQSASLNSDSTVLTDSSDDRPLSDFRRSSSSTANTNSTENNNNVSPTTLRNTGISPTPPSSFRADNRATYQIRYNQRLTTRDRRTTHTLYGGQQACRNFQAVAAAAKNAGALLITVGYNLNSSMMCSEHNSGPSPSSSTDNEHYISDIAPTDGSWTTSQRNACRSGSGTSSSPYVLRTGTCREGVTITYTSTVTETGNIVSQRGDDQEITDVLASAAGAKDVGPSSSNGCLNDTARAEENSDGDFFFCSASGDDMGPIFQTALSQVGTGVKLLSGLPR